MGWLLQYALASAAFGYLVMRVYDAIIGSIPDRVATVVRASLFVGVWTAVTTALGMRAFTKGVRALRRRTKGGG